MTSEGKALWPIYHAYQKDLQGLNERLAKTILAYADAYNKNTLTDEQANSLANAVLTEREKTYERVRVEVRKSPDDHPRRQISMRT